MYGSCFHSMLAEQWLVMFLLAVEHFPCLILEEYRSVILGYPTTWLGYLKAELVLNKFSPHIIIKETEINSKKNGSILPRLICLNKMISLMWHNLCFYSYTIIWVCDLNHVITVQNLPQKVVGKKACLGLVVARTKNLKTWRRRKLLIIDQFCLCAVESARTELWFLSFLVLI